MESLAVHHSIAKPTMRRPNQAPQGRRLLPLRKGHMRRRFACGRRSALRRWLADQLQGVEAAISGNGMDLIVDVTAHDAGGDPPDVTALVTAVVDDVPDAEVDALALSGDAADVRVAPGLPDALVDFMESPDVTHFGLFVRVAPPPHTFAAVVEKRRRPSGSGPVVKHVLLLNLWEYDRPTQNYVRLAVARALYRLTAPYTRVSGGRQQHFRQVLARTRQVRPPGVADFNLQAGDPDGGFCQHWNSFMLYHVLVEGRQPADVFAELHALSPQQRGALIVDWSNWAAGQASL